MIINSGISFQAYTISLILSTVFIFNFRKHRTRIPWQSYMIELDIFEAPFEGLMLAEVEFETELEAVAFIPPEWFGRDVTFEKEYHNSTLSRKGFD